MSFSLHSPPVTGADAFALYQAIRQRLPQAAPKMRSNMAANLAEIAAQYDGFALDAFGVLNVGQGAIAGAVARMAQLRAAGKALCVLSNAASYPKPDLVAKYHRLGFDFTADEVVSSRDVALSLLPHLADGASWAVISAAGDMLDDISAPCHDALATPDGLDHGDGVLFLSSARWTMALQERLQDTLRARPRMVVIANPDLVAPQETGFSLEPGYFGHALAQELQPCLRYIGKPYGDAFSMVQARLGGGAPHRLAMVGDTLHTDILGGNAAGFGTVLVTGHGLFRGLDVAPFVTESAITPDHIIPTT
ncbi:MAG: HAD hydrolase-like protein [Rhodobacteraceae bacterium]|nr:HAD hydrolase-like protein [Paracoccaceae bacterium]